MDPFSIIGIFVGSGAILGVLGLFLRGRVKRKEVEKKDQALGAAEGNLERGEAGRKAREAYDEAQREALGGLSERRRRRLYDE